MFFSTYLTNKMLFFKYLTDFRVIEMDHIKVDIKGLTPFFNWAVEDFAEYFIKKTEDEMVELVEIRSKDLLQEGLNKLTIP